MYVSQIMIYIKSESYSYERNIINSNISKDAYSFRFINYTSIVIYEVHNNNIYDNYIYKFTYILHIGGAKITRISIQDIQSGKVKLPFQPDKNDNSKSSSSNDSSRIPEGLPKASQ